MKKFFWLALSVFFVHGFTPKSFAQLDIPPENPKLIVQIVVSQMRYDYLQRYSSKFSNGGFKLLSNEGAVCRNARYNYLLTQSLPGLATISTGAYPSVHGIVSNRWFNPLTSTEIDAVADEKIKTVGGNYFNGKYSPKNLITSTIGDEIRMLNPKSKVIGISLEPSAAIISSGHNANGAYWLDNERGHWITNNHYTDSLPSWVDTLNVKGFGKIYLERNWKLLNPLQSYLEADTTAVKDPTALERIKTKLQRMVQGVVQPFKKPIKDYSPLLENPFGNSYTKDMAIAAIVGEELGKDNNTDFLSVVFTPTRNVGQKYGPHSIEMEDAFLRLDREIEHFIAFLNSEIGKHNYLLIITSDQGVSATPEHLEKSKIPGGYFEPQKAMMLLGSYLNIAYDTGNWILGYQEKQIYLNHQLIENSNLSLRDFQDRVAMFMLQFTGVANAVTAYNLQSSNFTSGIFEKFQNSYNQRRSGDVIINLEPGWVEKNGGVTSANSPYNYDTHVPLIWYGWKIKRKQVLEPVKISDIAPTISTLIGISWPSGATGKPIKEIIE
ncbi:MAG: alkaline phosphatase family protein [Tenuifilaceae bacterium]|nr:alkaline phosphatase family protein [Tenuifilaceae bacterium]